MLRDSIGPSKKAGRVRDEERIRVAVVEDKRRTREGLGAILGAAADLVCVGLYPSVETALPGLDRQPCDVLLLDIHLPGVSGVDAVLTIRERFPETRTLMLTVYEEEDKVFESICNGACGYLLKKTPAAELVEAVRQARRGGSPLSAEVARKIVTLVQKSHRVDRRESEFSSQEVHLLRLLADGHSYQSASERLGMSINTLRDRIRSVYEKLQVHSKSEAVSRALRRGLID